MKLIAAVLLVGMSAACGPDQQQESANEADPRDSQKGDGCHADRLISDVVYVADQEQEGGFSSVAGCVTRIEPAWLTITPDGDHVSDRPVSSRLYMETIVERVELAKGHSERDKATAEQYWNSRTHFDSLTASNNRWENFVVLLKLFPEFVQWLLVVILLLGALVYVSYRGYVSVNQQRLNVAKLEMEVFKLRGELLKLGLISETSETSTQDVPYLQHPVRAAEEAIVGFSLPVREFIKHSVFGVRSEAERQAAEDKWVEKWRSFESAWTRILFLVLSRLVLVFGLIFGGSLAMQLFMPFVVYTSAEFQGMELYSSVFYIVASFSGMVFVFRLRQRWKLMSSSLQRYRKET